MKCKCYLLLLVVVVSCCLPSDASAQTLVATPLRGSYELYEPVVFNVELRNSAIASLPSYPEQPLRRRVTAELWDKQVKVADAHLSGTGFYASTGDPTTAATTAWGCFGNKERKKEAKSGFVFWDRPGQYEVVIRDLDNNLVSERFSLVLAPPSDPEASLAFAAMGTESLALLHLQQLNQESRTNFSGLAERWPTSLSSRLIRMSLFLADTRSVAGAPRSVDSIIISDAAQIDLGHPFRLLIILEAAMATDPLAPAATKSKSLQQLREETNDPFCLAKASQIQSARRE